MLEFLFLDTPSNILWSIGHIYELDSLLNSHNIQKRMPADLGSNQNNYDKLEVPF